MKKRISFLLTSLLLIACNGGNKPTPIPTPTPTLTLTIEPTPTASSTDKIISEEVIFTKRTMVGHYYGMDNIIDVDTYFREDTLTQLPYISLKDYYGLLLDKDIEITKEEKDIYKVITANKEEAIINTNLDTLETDDYQNFISTTIYRQEGVTNVYFDGAPFIRVNSVEEDKKPRKTAINFQKYGINLFGVEGDILLPLVTASNIFMGPTMLTCFYNKTDIYFIDPNDPNCDTTTVLYDYNFQNGILDFFDGNKRSEDEANFSYGELCFFIDTYYGLPGRETLHQLLVEEKDLNKALLSYDEITRKGREYLLSTDLYEYLAGLFMLNDFLSDAGHSVVGLGADFLIYQSSSLRNGVNKALNRAKYTEGSYAASKNYDSYYLSKLGNAIDKAKTSDYGVIVNGDTALFTFNEFDYNIHDWNNYYENPLTNDLPWDTIGQFKRVLEKYKNTSVKNIVLDVTANGGGYGDVVVALMGMMGKPTYQYSHDMINDNHTLATYDFDANFDGVFDEKDKEVNYKYNYAILTSAYSFSCANMLPMQAKENGIMVLGDKSGGGSCAVLDAISAEGLYVRLSSQDHMVTLKNEEVEFGVEVDYQLVGDNYDFSNLYNIELMSQEINKFYN